MRSSSLRRAALVLAVTVGLGVVALAPATAQSEAPDFTVVALDYRFGGLPTSVPAGTTLGLVNQGAELHELIVARKNDGVTETGEELVAMGDAALEKVTPIEPRLFAAPGGGAEEVIVLEQEGEYLALCLVPQGMTELPDPSASPDPAFTDALPHVALGMMQPFTVTAAGTAPGPLPSAAPPAEARVIDFEMNLQMQITQDGQQIKEIPVTIGETVTFRITNTAGFLHNFYIGPDQALMTNRVEGLPGIPDYDSGTRELTWTVPEDVASLKFGCTVPGHYMLMNGSFVVQG